MGRLEPGSAALSLQLREHPWLLALARACPACRGDPGGQHDRAPQRGLCISSISKAGCVQQRRCNEACYFSAGWMGMGARAAAHSCVQGWDTPADEEREVSSSHIHKGPLQGRIMCDQGCLYSCAGMSPGQRGFVMERKAPYSACHLHTSHAHLYILDTGQHGGVCGQLHGQEVVWDVALWSLEGPGHSLYGQHFSGSLAPAYVALSAQSTGQAGSHQLVLGASFILHKYLLAHRSGLLSGFSTTRLRSSLPLMLPLLLLAIVLYDLIEAQRGSSRQPL